MSVVIDTNVLVVANGRHAAAPAACVEACIDALRDARRSTTLIDDAHEILDEYRRHCSFAGQPGAGDAFFKWLWDNQANSGRCERVRITRHTQRGFEEFPNDSRLRSFDADDRKFVAVALASGRAAPILNASDTDWWHHRAALAQHGVRVTFLCRELVSSTRRPTRLDGGGRASGHGRDGRGGVRRGRTRGS